VVITHFVDIFRVSGNLECCSLTRSDHRNLYVRRMECDRTDSSKEKAINATEFLLWHLAALRVAYEASKRLA
jgi:hypothetical protein